MFRRLPDAHVPVRLDHSGLDVKEALALARRASVIAAAPAQGTKDLVSPKVKGNIDLVAVIAPILLILIGAGTWWWMKYRRRSKSSGLSALPRIAPEVPALPEERGLQKRGMDTRGRWGPSFRWWWIKRARARGELSTTVAGNGSIRSWPGRDGSDDNFEMKSASTDTIKVGSNKASCSVSESAMVSRKAKPPVIPANATPNMLEVRRQERLTRESSFSSLGSRPEPIRDVLWWEGIDFDGEED